MISAKSRSRAAQRSSAAHAAQRQRSDLVPRNHMCIEYDILRKTFSGWLTRQYTASCRKKKNRRKRIYKRIYGALQHSMNATSNCMGGLKALATPATGHNKEILIMVRLCIILLDEHPCICSSFGEATPW